LHFHKIALQAPPHHHHITYRDDSINDDGLSASPITTHKHYKWELHPTRLNQYTHHWFQTKQENDRANNAIFWTPLLQGSSMLFYCNDCPATLLVDKAKFIARKEFKFEQEPTQNTPASATHPSTHM
jgi:hypothetical protein